MPPKRTKRGSPDAEVLPQEMERNRDPLTQIEQEESNEGASEEQKELSSQEFEKWKLEQEFMLKAKELELKVLQFRAEQETKQREKLSNRPDKLSGNKDN